MERTFDVAPTPEAVFAYLADFTSTNEWDPGTVETTRVDDGPLQLGARFHNVSEFRGRRTELEYELTTFDEPRHLVFTGRNKTVTSADDLTLSPNAHGGTTIRYQARFDFHGLAKLATPFLKSTFDRIADETIAQLRDATDKLVT